MKVTIESVKENLKAKRSTKEINYVTFFWFDIPDSYIFALDAQNNGTKLGHAKFHQLHFPPFTIVYTTKRDSCRI